MRHLRGMLVTLAIAGALLVGTAVALWIFVEPNRQLVLSTGTDGGTYAAFGDVMADTFAANENLRLNRLPSAGASENAARLASGAADIAFIQSDTQVSTTTTIAARLFPEAFHVVVRIDSGIRSVGDLRGKRVGIMPVGSGSNALFERLLLHYEVPWDGVATVHGTLTDHARAIETGEIDAFFMVVALGNRTIAEIIQSTPVQLIGIDQAEAMAMFDPALRASVVPIGTYSGERPVPAEPIRVVTVESLLAVRREVPDAVVERLVQGLFEYRQEMVRLIPQAAFISAPTDQDRLTFGVHPGAERYYTQDDPLFIVEYAEPMAFGLTALALFLSGLWQVRRWLAGARKNRADQYNLEIVEIVSRVESATRPEDFQTIRDDLFEIFEKVIVDLDNDRIEERSLLSFSFAWQAAASTLNHRQLLLADQQRAAAAMVGAPARSAAAE